MDEREELVRFRQERAVEDIDKEYRDLALEHIEGYEEVDEIEERIAEFKRKLKITKRQRGADPVTVNGGDRGKPTKRSPSDKGRDAYHRAKQNGSRSWGRK